MGYPEGKAEDGTNGEGREEPGGNVRVFGGKPICGLAFPKADPPPRPLRGCAKDAKKDGAAKVLRSSLVVRAVAGRLGRVQQAEEGAA